jgi:hypothetical protein
VDNRFAEKDHAIQGEEERDRFNPKRSCSGAALGCQSQSAALLVAAS